ncbi:lipid-A-disaccharide synthase [Blastochloris viridis]|uniref:Lipid-A-disaccharide synthase n=1 Tax=Blastochloris viridis TaxID=1079 RepID=A0A0H5BCD1_BLAVI|nr:lipid-A-disaccharide synthase [Blastochloris viridis]ALK10191.1 Lipid-A-disaccharide synthase [Blastochloris viridis]BAR99877.1 lipid-A-disaccharide synthase [Blastochloris viridis]CUU42855.1 Lipid-A-disaccharide synthase [Blastochloris viridis]
MTALDVFVVAGEASGDQLGHKLMAALKARTGGRVAFRGLGGAAMEREGLTSLFPISDIALVGFIAVARQLRRVLRRIDETARAIIANPPDVLVLIDSPDFSHRVAQRVRKRLPELPIVVYVSPTVWAWRSGRARAMAKWCDHILALLPFEPDSHRELGGPPCSYVGHPLVERLAELRPGPHDAARRAAEPPVLLVLPGSRHAELHHLLPVFADTLALLQQRIGAFEPVLPTLPHLKAEVEAAVAAWPVKPAVLDSEAGKLDAFRRARGALAASGTVTLELALAGVPTIAAYRGSAIEAFAARKLIRLPMFILANLVLGGIVVPEYLQADCTADKLAAALDGILREGANRARQLGAFARLDEVMHVGAVAPSFRAADQVIATFETKTGRRAPR